MGSRSTIVTAFLLAISTLSLAQRSDTNLTLTFSPSSDSDSHSCAASGSDSSITFSTSFLSTPGVGGCVNLAQVANDSYGPGNLINTSYSVRSDSTTNNSDSYPGYERVYISYAGTGQENFDPSANYSRVLYTQLDPILTHDSEPDDEKYFAPRNVNFYNGEDCLSTAEGEDRDIVPWVLSNCRARDDCQQFAFGVQSFYIYIPDEDSSEGGSEREKKGKCVLAAEYGAAGSFKPGLPFVGLMAMTAIGVLQMM